MNVRRLPDAGPCPLEGGTVPVNLSTVSFVSARGGGLPAAIARVLAPLTAVAAGTRPIRVVCDIRDAADRALYAAGFVASVQIPAQEVADGTLRLAVVAARIVETRITGYDGPLPAGIAARVQAIRGVDPLNRQEVERLLLLANDVPGLTLTLTLQPAGREPGDVIAVIDVQQRKALVLANYQNSGSRQLGRSLFSLRGEFYDLTGLADTTYIGVSQSSTWDEVHVIQGGHSMGLGAGGARIGVRASQAWSNPEIPGLDLRSRSLIAGLDLSAPLLRGFERTGRSVDDINIYAGAGAELINQRSIIRSGRSDLPYSRDRLRVAYARIGARVISRDAFGVTRVDTDLLVEARKGMSILDATRRGIDGSGFQPSRLDGDPEAFVIRGTANQTLRPFSGFDRLAFDLAAFGQWANRPLLNLEEFSIGNLTYGRGYDPGANAADRVVALRVAPRLRLTAPGSQIQVEATGFYDAVRLWNLDRGTSENDRLLQSVGGGLRLTMADRLAVDVSYAKPLDRALTIDARRPTDRLLVSITTQLAPWRFGR
ncbi:MULTISPECIES: ShlB/FhaC/HecB family hemolysin secretion/activation protein [Sphingomonas]|uniref:ShlB/FhaC/HecB family hemolysin secretion/activation protein n=1 Tax=Sphingomonas adhaesiva TaxID=28212 RepID=A0A2A4I6G7_9SPHN|nr:MULTISPECIES: ShlB/FhaC/HecB family hemolysin secretion/activation protein [Sphingomonas]PCG13373.1 ShlB/FhaC/HecB family hemolysin secretion/activation protein [Sphingomonas adhaesiva]PZU80397.1 MAG: ShlB/FhaC/HecB family hemolysin secretion/activation protein [Sphingomonas sp.]